MTALLRRVLHLAAGLLVLLGFLGAGEWLVRLAAVPVPGSVAGMVALAACLRAGVVPMALLRPAADALLRHMSLFFVPPGVGLMLYGALLRQQWPAILGGALAGTGAVLAVVGLLAQHLETDD